MESVSVDASPDAGAGAGAGASAGSASCSSVKRKRQSSSDPSVVSAVDLFKGLSETDRANAVRRAANNPDPTDLVNILRATVAKKRRKGTCHYSVRAVRVALSEVAPKAKAILDNPVDIPRDLAQLLDEVGWFLDHEDMSPAQAVVTRLCDHFARKHKSAEPEREAKEMMTQLASFTTHLDDWMLRKEDTCLQKHHCSVDNPVRWFLRLFSRLRGGYQTRWRCDDHDRGKRFTPKQIQAFLDEDGHTYGVPIPHIVKVICSAIFWCLEQLDAAGLEWPQFLKAVRELVTPGAWSRDITSFTTHLREWWRCNNPGPSASNPSSCGVASV